MIVLWLLVAHLVGDYLLQTRWQAAGKFGGGVDAFSLRTRHVFTYTACFAPIALVYAGATYMAADFLALLYLAHFITDAQRFTRTPGEWIWWQWRARGRKHFVNVFGDDRTRSLEPNPWPTIGLAIDQTLHLIQIAVLAELFLR